MLKIPDPIKLSVLSWNIDGLDERDIEIRTQWICNIINKELPDIVMLQEVIDESSWIIRSYCQQNNEYLAVLKTTYYYNSI